MADGQGVARHRQGNAPHQSGNGTSRLFDQAMEVYYAAEELSRDPAHAHLIPLVEDLRATFERDMGYPIPPRS